MAAPATITDLLDRAAAARPDQLALADAPNRSEFFGDAPRRLTWQEVAAATDTLAARLQGEGVGPGDVVAIQLPNIVELVISLLATSHIGAIGSPYPVQHRGHELRHGFTVAPPAAVITAPRPDRPDQMETVATALAATSPATLFSFAAGDSADGKATPLSLDDPASTVAPHPGATDDVATICWTSGTTGTPKGVPRTHAMWLASCSFQVEHLRMSADDRMLCPFPVVNMAGIGGMMLPWAMAGATIHLHQPLDLPVFLGQLGGEAVTYTVAPPALLNMLLANEAMLADVDLSNVRAISSGSAPLDPWMVEGWQARGIEIVNVFGSNEGAAMLSTMAEVPDPTDRARFFPVPDRTGIDVRLVDLATGAAVTEPGVLGELRFRGATVFDGYLESDGSEFDDEGFYRTGDLFELAGPDRPRLLRFVDRAKDIIIRGGMNISAAEVEGLVAGHPDIVECAAVAYPDPTLGERVGLFVVATSDATPTLESIVDHLRAEDIASYKLPERIEMIEALPRNPVGKVLKPELRAAWA